MSDDQLEQVHAAALAASIPPTMRRVRAAAAAAMLDYSTSHFLQRIACRPDFPVAKGMGDGRRWLLSEIHAWAEAQPDYVPRRKKAA